MVYFRFIPACAGNRNDSLKLVITPSVHPRVCGEQVRRIRRNGRGVGSSPRVRGTGLMRCLTTSWRRFIPACAGNRLRRQCRCASLTVHPRVCGEQHLTTTVTESDAGSSPRVRGTGCALHHGCFAMSGSSPRVRGTGLQVRQSPPPRSVHPRVCGEQTAIVTAGFTSARFIPACAGNRFTSLICGAGRHGSSPRVRGTGPHLKDNCAIIRFIPACAGNSSPRRIRRVTLIGSSPRVRGTVQRDASQAQATRFIPACAGNSHRGRRSRRADAVHPRVCGEQLIFQPGCNDQIAPSTVHPRVCGEQVHVAEPVNQQLGSSPRVRGTADRTTYILLYSRFIPACAGNSFPTPIL